MIVYINNHGFLVEDARVSPFDRGFLFADGVYESIRTYNKKLFRYNDHLERLKRSLTEIKIDFDDFDSIEKNIYELIEKNRITEEALVYLQITRGNTYPRTHHLTKQKITPTVFISVSEIKSENLKRNDGIKVILQEDLRWLRCDIKSISLLPVVLVNQKASLEGAGEAILERNGLITEGSHTNFFAVREGTIFTTPLSNLILEGITRREVLELCAGLNITVKEEYIRKDNLKDYDEFFITSTSKEITPVLQIDDRKINGGITGPTTKKLQSAFNEIKARH